MWRILAIATAAWLGVCITNIIFPDPSPVSIVMAFVAIDFILKRWKEAQRQRNLIRVIKDEDSYQAAFQAGGKDMVVNLAFCELFVANCLEVRELQIAGDPKHEYRLNNDVDISMLHAAEQVVARNLFTYKSFPQLHQAASKQLEQCNRNFLASPKARSILVDASGQGRPELLADLYERILSDAIAYNPPETSCGV